jgi:DNA primase
MTDPRDEEALIEAACTAWRPRTVEGNVRAHPACYDLDPEARVRAHDLTAANRALEAALDSEGLSSTVHALLARIYGGG